MNHAKQEREKVLAEIPKQEPNSIWQAVSPQDRNRVECERFSLCHEDATWTAVQGNVHVCDYHRFIFEIQRVLERMGSNSERAA